MCIAKIEEKGKPKAEKSTKKTSKSKTKESKTKEKKTKKDSKARDKSPKKKNAKESGADAAVVSIVSSPELDQAAALGFDISMVTSEKFNILRPYPQIERS